MGQFKSCTRVILRHFAYIELLHVVIKWISPVWCWMMSKALISVLARGIIQQLRLFGLWDFAKWRGSTRASRNFNTGVRFLWGWWDVMLRPESNLECCSHWVSFWISLSHGLQVTVNEICLLSTDLMGRKKIESNKVLCSKLIEKILIWLTASLRSFSENVISEAVCDLQYASSTKVSWHTWIFWQLLD